MSKMILLSNDVYERYKSNPEVIATSIILLGSKLGCTEFEAYSLSSLSYNLYGRIFTKKEKAKLSNNIKILIQDDFIKINSNKVPNLLILSTKKLTNKKDFISVNMTHFLKIFQSADCKSKENVLLTYLFLLKHFDRTPSLKGTNLFNKFYWLSQEYAASSLDFSVRQIRNYLKTLESLNVISSVGFSKLANEAQGWHSLNIYSLYENKVLISDFARIKGLIPNKVRAEEVNQHRKLAQVYNNLKEDRGNYAPSVLAELVAYLSSKDSAPPLDPIISYCSEHKIDISPYLYDYDIEHSIFSLFSANP